LGKKDAQMETPSAGNAKGVFPEKAVTFLKKSNQKTFAPLRAVLKKPGSPEQKSFAELFQKRPLP
jgi:hypothetical protein